jgi:hypothetical protein
MSKTVKVMLPVAIDYTGKWYSGPSWSEADPLEQLDALRRQLSGFSQHMLITAEVPIPEPVEVEGRVSE